MRLSARLYSLWRGLRSVLYYYFSCSPWHLAKRKRVQKKQDKADRQQKEEQDVELATSGQYLQPATFDTNPHWAREIALGPRPSVKRQSKKQKQYLDRFLTLATSTRSSTPEHNESESNLANSSLDGQAMVRTSAPDSEGWRLHQREDDILWGSEAHLQLVSQDSRDITTGKQPYRKTHHIPYKPSYAIARNPPINDQSPPIVSNPAQSLTSNMWMLQGPPRAEVMSGHESMNHSRATTISSDSSRRTGQVSLSRQLSRRLVEEKRNRASLLFPNERHEGSINTLGSSYAPTEASLIESSYDLDNEDGDPRRSLQVPPTISNASTTSVIHSPGLANASLSRMDPSLDYTDTSVRGTLPWLVPNHVNGSQHRDFAVPLSSAFSRARSSTNPSTSPWHRPDARRPVEPSTQLRMDTALGGLYEADSPEERQETFARFRGHDGRVDSTEEVSIEDLDRPNIPRQHLLRRWSFDI